MVAVMLLVQGCAGSPQAASGQPVAPTARPSLSAETAPAWRNSGTPSAETALPAAAPSKQPVPAGKTVGPKVDEASYRSALISASSGGRIELKAASGITYTLDIPKNALVSDQVIWMAPVTQVDGLPLSGGLLGAVELRPQGTRLMKPATLTIQVPSSFETADLTGFAYQGAGDDFHLYPVTARGRAITASIIHFSAYGGGQGTQADEKAARTTAPSTPESRYEQDIASALDDARRTGSDPSSMQQLEDAVRNFFDAQVYPDLKKAETDDQFLDAAGNEYLTWSKSLELLGMDSRLGKEITKADSSLKKGIRNAYDRASQRCVSDLDWEQGVKMIQRAREVSILYGTGYEDLQSKIQKCWTFRLDFESVIRWELDDNMDITAHVKAQVPLKLNDDLSSLEGRAPLKYVDYKVSWRGPSAMMNSLCTISSDTTDTYLSVSPFLFGASTTLGKSTVFPQMRGFFQIGDTSEKWSWVCSSGAGGGTVKTNMPFPTVGWSMGYRKTNKVREFYTSLVNGEPDGPPSYLYNLFRPVGKPVIARETGSGTAKVDHGDVNESYTIDIVHMPKGGATDISNTSNQSSDPPRKPIGPKTTDVSVLPEELKSIPAPDGFAVVDQSATRSTPDGIFQFAQASWWGPGTISAASDFYRQALAMGWNPGDDSMGQYSFDMSFVSKTDTKRTLTLNGKTEGDGIRITETIRQK